MHHKMLTCGFDSTLSYNSNLLSHKLYHRETGILLDDKE